MLIKRVLSAIVLIPLVGAAVYFGGIALFLLVLVAALGAGYEYLAMMRRKGQAPSYVLGLLFIGLFVVDAQWPQFRLLPLGLVFIPLLALTAEVFHGNAPGSLFNWALLVSGGVYIGFPLSHFVRLRLLEHGLYWVVIALLGTWVCDTAAYFVGCSIGRHKFFPKISPKKTWEGAIAGLVFGVLAVALLSRFLLGLWLGWGALLGLLLVLGATFGDLAESVIKRQVGVKDSSNLIPGHGGLLDRVDSLLFVVPIVYYFAVALGG